MELQKLSSKLQELSFQEATQINGGGESIWYWVAYGIGSVIGFVGATAGTIRPSEYR